MFRMLTGSEFQAAWFSNCERTVSEACHCPPHHEVAACWWSKTAVTAATANIDQPRSNVPLV